MKSLNLLAAAAMLAVCTTASAQFSNTSSSTSSARTADTQGWSTVYVQWNPTTAAIENNSMDDPSFTVFSLGYSKATNIASNTPLFVEYGLGVQYFFTTVDYDDDKNPWASIYDQKYNMLSAKIPVSLTYKWHLSNSSIDILPFAGINFRFNILGSKKLKSNMENEVPNDTKDNLNLFDKDDMGSKDATWKRFQAGWQIGVNARFNEKLLIGISYGTDFSEIVRKTKLNTTSITLGYCF